MTMSVAEQDLFVEKLVKAGLLRSKSLNDEIASFRARLKSE